MPDSSKYKWVEQRLPPDFPAANARCFEGTNPRTGRELTVLVSQDAGRWHLSISSPSTNPSWEDITEARYRFLSAEAFMVMCLPPKEFYVNVHQHCFHLWETQDIHLVNLNKGG
jgi:hypothetical protein